MEAGGTHSQGIPGPAVPVEGDLDGEVGLILLQGTDAVRGESRAIGDEDIPGTRHEQVIKVRQQRDFAVPRYLENDGVRLRLDLGVNGLLLRPRLAQATAMQHPLFAARTAVGAPQVAVTIR